MSQVIHHTYTIDGIDIPVTWESYDFTNDVSAIPNKFVRTVLRETGVMYLPAAEPKIRVSHLLDPDLQGYSAAHEELCMEQKMAPCHEVEDMVIDAVPENQRPNFITMRARMFGALCIMDGDNAQFATTLELLQDRNSSS